ncbi:Nicotinate dehydrogenase medium molybdopterin subunit [Candidatus Calditenuaceae archaeon HR02]|nr:Nicotinate dehydrogenase medium molybdopterin subunit [Candidatus Calditenuaceae archaeon HR02]
MAKLRGRGIAAICYPTGMNLGGDPSQTVIIAQPDGTFVVNVASVELGQGLRTVLAQIAAEAIGASIEDIEVRFGDTQLAPHDTGTFASRTTHRMGNAIIKAGQEVRQILLDVASKILEVSPQDLEIRNGKIWVRGVPDKFISVREVASQAQFVYNIPVVGKGHYVKPKSIVDPETGESDPHSTMAHGCVVADVEVDTETGEVTVLRLFTVYEVGRAVNPKLVEGQIIGGAVMGLGAALRETVYPRYPQIIHQTTSFREYVLPTAGDVPKIIYKIVESPTPTGPYGAKGVGEMVANGIAPAIVNAVYDAIGVQITELPITPEKVLKALSEKGKSK